MKSNRREFLKGALAGMFGAALTWLGAVRAEDEPAPESIAPTEWAQCAWIRAPDQVWVISNRGSVFHSDDMGETWHEQIIAQSGDRIAQVIWENADHRFVNQWINGFDSGRIWSPSPAWSMAITEDGWTIASDDEGETWHEFSEEEIADMQAVNWSDPSVLAERGVIWSDAGSGFGNYVHWSKDGSDENGKGTYEDPVATEACAQSIADNPPFRV